ncbi:MAG TPA: hypothetical protein VFW75_11980 [Acetobacteraceae bacterium]|nr:hypothetical protein [Acetobacteraceae bacterium]
MLISATSTVMVLAGLLLRISRRRLAVQVGLHGDLNGLRGWRPRNPLKRALDLRSRMQAREPQWLRFLVLEDAIRQELFRIAPQAAEQTDVLPLPVNVGELGLVPEPRLELPLQVGFVGQATEAKGISSFLDVARTLKHRYGNAIEFHLIGRVPPGSDLGRFAVLDSPPTSDHLPRQDFLERLGRQHFVFLPFQAGYYNLSASGALLDALTWLKPIIATKLPIVVDLFARHGDIGYLCDDARAMRATLEGVLATMDTGHYRWQVEALRAARATRLPEAVARQYREILDHGFSGLLTGDASAE